MKKTLLLSIGLLFTILVKAQNPTSLTDGTIHSLDWFQTNSPLSTMGGRITYARVQIWGAVNGSATKVPIAWHFWKTLDTLAFDSYDSTMNKGVISNIAHFTSKGVLLRSPISELTLPVSQITNGASTTGSYANPSWITSLASSKVTGLATVATTGAYSDLTGKPMVTQYYNGSGLINQQIKKWTGQVTPSTASGQSIDISSAGFSTITSVNIAGFYNVATVKGALVAGKTVSTSAIVVNIYESKNTGVLIGGNVEGLEFHPSPGSLTLYVEVTGY